MSDDEMTFPVLSSWLLPELERRGFGLNKKATRAKRSVNGVLQVVERYIGKWGWYVELGAHPLVVDRDFDVGRSKPLMPRKVNECLFQERLIRRSLPFMADTRERWSDEVVLLGEDLAIRNVRDAFTRECDRGLFSLSAADLTSSDYFAFYGLRSMAHALVLHDEGDVLQARKIVEDAAAACTSDRERAIIEETASALSIGSLGWPSEYCKAPSWPAYFFIWVVEFGAATETQIEELKAGEMVVRKDVRRQAIVGFRIGFRVASSEACRMIVRPSEFSLATGLIDADLERLGIPSQSRPKLLGLPSEPDAVRRGLRLEVLSPAAHAPIEVGTEEEGQLVVSGDELYSAFEKIGASSDDEVCLRFTWGSA